jgi:aminopeptidase N
MDTITAERTATGVKLYRKAPAAHPADRPHQLTIGGYDESGNGSSVPVLLDADEVEVELDPSIAVIVPDAADDTWAKIRLDAQSLGKLTAVMPKIEDGVTRAVILNSLRDATADAELDPRLGFDIVIAALPAETSDIAVSTMAGWANSMLGRYLPVEPYRARLAAVLTERLQSVPAGSSLQLAVARRVVAVTDDVELLTGWLAGNGVPDGLSVDADLRWVVTLRLATLGAVDDAGIDAELARDTSSEGVVHATRCRAALPTAEAKERAWAQITTDPDIANYELYAACEGFWHKTQLELTAPYVDRYFAEIAGTEKLRSGWVVARTAMLAFPVYAVDERVAGLAAGLFADEDVPAGIRRAVGDHRDDLLRTLAVRAAYPVN